MILSKLTLFQISELASVTNRAGNTQVQKLGWFLFGGFKSNLTQAQQLENIQGQWQLGPPLFKNETVNGQCVVQVKDSENYLTFSITSTR